jgi:serine protease Do
MRTSQWIGTVILGAAGLLTSAAWAQQAPPAPPRPPRARTATTISSSSSYLGIGVQDVDADRAKALNLKEVRGAEITHVQEDSPAAKAGFKDGDVVWEYNGQPVEGREQLTRLIQETPVGRQVKVQVWRNGAFQTLMPTVGERGPATMWGGRTFVMPEIPEIPQIEIPQFRMEYPSPMLGITGESLGQQSQFADFFGVKDGVLVKSVTQNSAAEKAGIKAGDVVVRVDDTPVKSTREITSALRAARNKKTITVVVMRNKHEVPLTVTIEPTTTSGGAVRASVYVSPRVVVVPRVEVNPRVILERLRPVLLKLSADYSVI